MTESTAITVPHYAQVQMSTFGQGALPALQSLADVVSIAQLMAKAGVAVRKHLRENPGACLAVTMQALRWNADPFAVANKSYAVNDQLAYEAQMIAAVINTMAPIKRRPKYTYDGENGERTCTVTVDTLDGDTLEVTSPKFKDITPKNSPLWKSDPDQQQGYYTIRALARRHFPEVILGIYDPEEAASMEPNRIQPHKEDLVGKLSSAVGEDGFQRDRVETELASPPEPPKPKRGRPPKAQAEPEEAMHAAQPLREGEDVPEEVTVPLTEADEKAVREIAVETVALENGAEGERLTVTDPEPMPLQDVTADIPDYMRDGPDTIEQAQAELDAGGPEDEWPDDFREFTETVDTGATTFTEIKKAQSVFFNSETFKTMAPEIQNRLRANIWTTCLDRKEQGTLTGVPDIIEDVSAFRLAIETLSDPEAISGTYVLLQKSDAWSRTPATARETIDKAVQVRLGAI
jgi:RecT family protein